MGAYYIICYPPLSVPSLVHPYPEKIGIRVQQGALEYPQFLIPETSRMPDFIGWDEFSEVK